MEVYRYGIPLVPLIPAIVSRTSWFILEEAKNHNWDKEMVDTALTILDWSLGGAGTKNTGYYKFP